MMVPVAPGLNRAAWNAMSSASRKKKAAKGAAIEDSIPLWKKAVRNRPLDQPRSGLSFCDFSDCTFRKVWSPMVATR